MSEPIPRAPVPVKLTERFRDARLATPDELWSLCESFRARTQEQIAKASTWRPGEQRYPDIDGAGTGKTCSELH